MFTLKEVKEFAATKGYTEEEIEIKKYCSEYDWDSDLEIAWDYEVSFGHEYTEVWSWTFEDLDGTAIDYEHMVWED